MTLLSRLRRILPALVLGAWLAASGAHAAPTVITEVGDAGDTLGTAQVIGVLPHELRLLGSLSLEPSILDRVDVFRVTLIDGLKSLGTLFDSSLLADPVLFLFDALGRGVAMDDESGGNGQALFGALSLLPGDYFLAIAFAGMEPLDSSDNPIFNTFGNGAVLTTTSLFSFAGFPFATDQGTPGNYEIVAVPTPATALLAALGLAILAQRRIRRA